jgi:hypothetical protein
LAFQDIAGWQITSMANPRSVKQEGAPLFVPLLALRDLT